MVKKKEKDSSTLTAEIIDDFGKRDFYLSILDDAINKLHHKATNGRIRDAKNEKLKIDMYRALFYGVNVANSVYKDKQIDEMADDFERLKKGLEIKKLNKKSGSAADVEITDDELNDLINFDERIRKLKNDDDSGGD